MNTTDSYVLENSRLGLGFHQANPSENVDIFNFSNCTNVCKSGKQQFLVRRLDAVSEPILLDHQWIDKVTSDEVIILLADQENNYSGKLSIRIGDLGIHYHLDLTTSEHIWLLEWNLSGFEAEEIIVPALGGQSLTEQMPVGTQLSYKYPFWLNAQFIIGESEEGGFYIRSQDTSTDMKLVRIKREKSTWTLTYGFEIGGNSDLKSLTADWYLDVYTDKWNQAVEVHRTWLEKSFQLKEKYENPQCPKWMRDINFVLEMWGAKRDSELPHHSFDQMIARIEEWENFYPPEKTLLYLPGFAENGIDSHAPEYGPSKRCGGVSIFKSLVDRAHELGYKVMVHTNVLAMTFTHPLFNDYKKYQVVDIFGRPQCWGLDMDGDWLAEPYFAYINPGYEAWGDLMIENIGEIIQNYQIDSVFLDQTLLAFNIKDGPDFIRGIRDHIERLQKKFPNILFAGEGLHEQNVSCLPVAQIHGLDSIKEVHGLDGLESWRKVHPVSKYLFGKYTTYVPHLLTKHPSNPLFRFQESAYKQLDIIPTLVLYDSEQNMNVPELKDMIERANQKKS
jgi:hypothetical protein